MGRNKTLRKRTRGIRRSIAVHEEKIREEMKRASPNRERIRHWEVEIENWRRELDYLERSLPQKEK
jgi:hypothetical protein